MTNHSTDDDPLPSPSLDCRYEDLFALALRVIGAYLLSMQTVAIVSSLATMIALTMYSDVWANSSDTGWKAFWTQQKSFWIQGIAVFIVNATFGVVLILAAPRLARFCYRSTTNAPRLSVDRFTRAGLFGFALQVLAVWALLLAIRPAASLIASRIQEREIEYRTQAWMNEAVMVVLYLAAALALWLCGRACNSAEVEPEDGPANS